MKFIKASILISCGVLWLAVQFVFFGIYLKSTAFDSFLRVKKHFDYACSSASSMEDSFGGLISGPDTVILRLPSLDKQGVVLPGLYDRFTAVKSGSMLVISQHPDPASSRKKYTYYLRSMKDFSFTSTGAILGFKYHRAPASFDALYYIDPLYLPAKQEKSGGGLL
ncbi:MAG: hypothetical protein LLG37_01010 [Spirochaetia bacterium]|nr:hypothetical protein [Spirochaetia bacterium]